jgi:hypothetical protein
MPARLSKEILANLAHGGVAIATFKELYENELQMQFDQLSQWEGPDHLAKLWRAVFDIEHVLISRLRKEAGGLARVRGWVSRKEDADLEMDFDAELEDSHADPLSLTTGDTFPGLPLGLSEQVLSFLASGFSPADTPVLKHKFEVLINGVVAHYLEKYNVGIPFSLEAFAVPGMIRNCNVSL